MSDLFRDSTFGRTLNYLSNGRILPYPEQRSTYVLPAKYQSSKPMQTSPLSRPASIHQRDSSPALSNVSSADTLVEPTTPAHLNTRRVSGKVFTLEEGSPEVEEKRLGDETEKPSPVNPYLVDWEGPDDPENPQNWSRAKKIVVAAEICLLTFAVYAGSAIYTVSIPSLMATFDVGVVHATLGLTLFVLAYGIGPMFLAPFQELSSYGRNPVYIFGLLCFTLFQLPIIYAKNFATILAFRFLTGFVGSPALATGGASIQDFVSQGNLPIGIGFWAIGAVLGPVLAPVLGGFAAQANGWKWPILELTWISAFALLVLFFCLPETHSGNILLRRAQRLRKLTGNNQYRSQSEIDQAAEGKVAFLKESLMRPILLCFEPAVMFSNVYIGLVYSIFYLWFEAFPLTFNDIYGMSLGVGSLPFLGFLVSGAITYTFYVWYNKVWFANYVTKKGSLVLEDFLKLGLVAACFVPISLFMFGWSARSSVHYIVPIIGAALYLPGIFLLFQCILMYLALSYPKHSASVLAGNDLFRSSMASAFPLFGRAFFHKLGLGGGSSLLAGLSILMIPLYYMLVRYGAKLRTRSRYATSE